jgi:hypothetical protein
MCARLCLLSPVRIWPGLTWRELESTKAILAQRTDTPRCVSSLLRSIINNRFFPRAYVEVQCKIALAKKENVCLFWNEMESTSFSNFPPLDQVEPKGTDITGTEQVAFNADYLARCVLVAKAGKTSAGEVPPVRIVHLTGPLDPIRIDIGESDGSQYARLARVTIMPVRV